MKLKLQVRAIHPQRDNGSVPVIFRFLRDDGSTVADTLEVGIALNPKCAETMKVGDILEFDQVVVAK